MTADALEQILELVEQGRLTAEEAAPLLAALEETEPGRGARGNRPGKEPPGHGGAGFGAGFAAGFGADAMPEPPGGWGATPPPGSGSGAFRLEVREGGRQVVNLRLPIAVGRLALDSVPGLSGEQVERVREALRTGMRGPILVVEDGDNLVSIVLE